MWAVKKTSLYFLMINDSVMKTLGNYCGEKKQPFTVSTSIPWAVKIFIIFTCTSVQFTIVVMTWHDLALYYIVLIYANFRSGFPSLAYKFRCILFSLLIEQHMRFFLFFCFIRHPILSVIIYLVFKPFVCDQFPIWPLCVRTF